MGHELRGMGHALCGPRILLQNLPPVAFEMFSVVASLLPWMLRESSGLTELRSSLNMVVSLWE